MSSSKQPKHVHYERGTKGAKSSHRSRDSNDSGVGSGSASDRASLGTTPNDSPFTYAEIESQKHILSAVQEALNAAREEIRTLQALNLQLNEDLAESNKENRILKREKKELHNKVDHLLDDLEAERKTSERLRRERSPRSANGSDGPSRRTIEAPRQPPTGERRSSYYAPPTVPQAPQNPNPNPFTPLSERQQLPIVTYAPQLPVTYAPSTASYVTAPVYAVSQPSHRQQPPNDGRYHLTPL